jgi:hypothetical protein
MTKELVMDIIEKIETDDEVLRVKAWIEVHEDIVEWMTEPTKFPPRSNCG